MRFFHSNSGSFVGGGSKILFGPGAECYATGEDALFVTDKP